MYGFPGFWTVIAAACACSVVACGSDQASGNAAGSAGAPSAGSGGAGTGAGGSAVPSGGGAGGSLDAAAGGASPDVDSGGREDASASADASMPSRDGASDASDTARATPPCGTDLDVDNGRVVPEYGSLPAPRAWNGSDPASDGPLSVTAQPTQVPIVAGTLHAAGQTITVTAGTLVATAYVPAGTGPFPLVLVLPGFTQSHTAYATFSQHFASHGFAALGVDTRAGTTVAVHDKEAYEVVQTIDWVLSGKSPLGAKIDATKIAVAGHSKGGKVAFFAAALDPRIDLVIGWDPSNSGGGPCAFDPNCNALPVAPNCAVNDPGLERFMHAETLVIGAPPDPLFNPDENANAKHFYRGAPSPAAYVLLNASHASWADGLNPDVIRISKYVHIARLLSRFGNVSGLDAYLPLGTKLPTESLFMEAHEK